MPIPSGILAGHRQYSGRLRNVRCRVHQLSQHNHLDGDKKFKKVTEIYSCRQVLHYLSKCKKVRLEDDGKWMDNRKVKYVSKLYEVLGMGVFACQEVEGDAGSQDLGCNPDVREWWAYMADIMEANPDNSPVSIPLDERYPMD